MVCWSLGDDESGETGKRSFYGARRACVYIMSGVLTGCWAVEVSVIVTLLVFVGALWTITTSHAYLLFRELAEPFLEFPGNSEVVQKK
jgi:hypothetical protein